MSDLFQSRDRKRVIRLLEQGRKSGFATEVKKRLARMAFYLEKRERLTSRELAYLQAVDRGYPQ